jgi:GT2 family glycosyltransferase
VSAPSVSFITPVFNRLDLTEAFVAALRSTAGETGEAWEAILVDDASADGTAAFLDALEPPFRVIHLRENSGFARAVNTGAAAARGPILGLLNNDLVLRPGWLPPMLQLLRTAPMAAAVGNIQVDPATGLVDHAGIFFDPDGMPAHAHKHRRRPPRGPWRERNAATAACMLVRAGAFRELGGFCEDYRNGMEDVDLCVRMRLAGHRIYVSHESVVGHHVSSSPGRNDANAANTALFRRRHAADAAPWGRVEWPAEYFRRYARRWWRMDPARAWRALRMLLAR